MEMLADPGQTEAGKEYGGFAILPMPKVSDSNGAEWGESDLNVFGVAAAGVPLQHLQQHMIKA